MDDLFKPASLATLAGCITAVIVIVNTTQHVCGWGPRWFALAVALIIACVAYTITRQMSATPQTATVHWSIRVLIVVLNGCLMYTSAFGIQNQAIAKKGAGAAQIAPAQAPPRTFRAAW